jgi:hypothetical protein
MSNRKFPFHIKSAILLVGICSCVLDEDTEQVGEQLELEEAEVSEPRDVSRAQRGEQTGIGEIDSNDAETTEVSADPLRGDFDGDGHADLAIGVVFEELDGVSSGAVAVFYGSDEGLDADEDQVFHRETSGLQGEPEPDDQFGHALAVGDFNNDGYADLAIGAPFDDIGVDDAGSVTVLYGSKSGLSSQDSQLWHQNVKGIEDDVDENDNFGSALTTGDFNDDGYDDLAIGAPGEQVSGEESAGLVHVIYGTAKGLDQEDNQIWHQGTDGVTGLLEKGDRFGTTLAAGDFDDDGSDDLVIGVPFEDIGDEEDAGWVHVLYGSVTSNSSTTSNGGLSTEREEVWHQDIKGIEDSAEEFDSFGFALAVGDFDGDDEDDLAIGAPGEEVDSKERAGAVNVIYGSDDGLTETDDQFWNEDTSDLDSEAEDDESFGYSLAAGDFDDDGNDDLAIGAPNEDFQGAQDAGRVQVLYGESDGLSGDGDQRWHQSIAGIEGVAEGGDRFAKSLSTGDFDGEGTADLVIGVPLEDVGDKDDAGAINVIYGDDSGGLSRDGNQVFHQDSPDVSGLAEPDDMFGFALGS